MVTSTTGKGVVLIGGQYHINGNLEDQKLLYELSGDSVDNLSWTLLDQKLSHARSGHVSFTIPNHISEGLVKYALEDNTKRLEDFKKLEEEEMQKNQSQGGLKKFISEEIVRLENLLKHQGKDVSIQKQ